MTKEKLIEIIEALKAKQKKAKMALRSEKLLENRAYIERYIKRIDSICDRLCFNWNMLPESQTFFENTLAEAELHLS